MIQDYEDMLKLPGNEYWKALEQYAKKSLDKYIINRHEGKPITLDEQKIEYESLKKHYNDVCNNPAFKGGIDAITKVMKWFDANFNEFSETIDYYLVRNMIYYQADISSENALEYGDEWLSNQYEGIGEFWR